MPSKFWSGAGVLVPLGALLERAVTLREAGERDAERRAPRVSAVPVELRPSVDGADFMSRSGGVRYARDTPTFFAGEVTFVTLALPVPPFTPGAAIAGARGGSLPALAPVRERASAARATAPAVTTANAIRTRPPLT